MVEVPFASAASMAKRCEMDLSPGTVMRPAARLEGKIVAEPSSVVGIGCTIAFAFPGQIGLVLLVIRLQPEAVLLFTYLAPPCLRAAGGTR